MKITKAQLKKLIKEELEEAAERTPEQLEILFRTAVGDLTTQTPYFELEPPALARILREVADDIESQNGGDF